MEVVGVQTIIALSDSQKVALYPTQQKVLIHKGLNFDFDGRVEAGRFTFYSRENKFNYDLFPVQHAGDRLDALFGAQL